MKAEVAHLRIGAFWPGIQTARMEAVITSLSRDLGPDATGQP